MTREEALYWLDTIPTIGEQVDALEMAINALEQEPKTENVTEFADRCKECGAKYGRLLKQEPKADVLDKIRAEINEQKKCVELDVDDDLVCLFWYIVGLNNAIEIIDKYRKEG